MKTFLLKNNIPTIKFSLLPDNVFFEGSLPSLEYNLAVCPTNEKQIILDVDVKNNKNGFNYIPSEILKELELTFHYSTKTGGEHYFLNYTGNNVLLNTSTKYGLDLRIGANKKTKNAGGYVKYNHNVDVRDCLHLIKDTSESLNYWLEGLFSYK